MSLFSAKCPCCGGEIRFDEKDAEHVCAACGTKLLTSALEKSPVADRIEPESEPEPQREREHHHSHGSEYEHHHRSEQSRGRERECRHGSEHRHSHSYEGEHHHSHDGEHHHRHDGEHHHSRESEREAPQTINAPELTEKEIAEELERKAAYKQELKKTVKQIDSLRERRSGLRKRKGAPKKLSIAGAVMAAVAVVEMLLLADNEETRTLSLIAGGVLALLATAMFISSVVSAREIKNSLAKVEEKLSSKKDRRDELISKLDGINRKLHIHSK